MQLRCNRLTEYGLVQDTGIRNRINVYQWYVSLATRIAVHAVFMSFVTQCILSNRKGVRDRL